VEAETDGSPLFLDSLIWEGEVCQGMPRLPGNKTCRDGRRFRKRIPFDTQRPGVIISTCSYRRGGTMSDIYHYSWTGEPRPFFIQ